MKPDTFAEAARHAAWVAASLLGWPPGVFWAATPAELVTALGLDTRHAPPAADAARLAQLMEAFPDG